MYTDICETNTNLLLLTAKLLATLHTACLKGSYRLCLKPFDCFSFVLFLFPIPHVPALPFCTLHYCCHYCHHLHRYQRLLRNRRPIEISREFTTIYCYSFYSCILIINAHGLFLLSLSNIHFLCRTLYVYAIICAADSDGYPNSSLSRCLLVDFQQTRLRELLQKRRDRYYVGFRTLQQLTRFGST